MPKRTSVTTARDTWSAAFRSAATQSLQAWGISEEDTRLYLSSYAVVPASDAAGILTESIKNYQSSDVRKGPTPTEVQEALRKISRGAFLIYEGFRVLGKAGKRSGQQESEYGQKARSSILGLARILVGRMAKRTPSRAFAENSALEALLPRASEITQATRYEKQAAFVSAFKHLAVHARLMSEDPVPPATRAANNTNEQFISDLASAWSRITRRKPSLAGKADYDSPFYRFVAAMYGYVQGRLHASVLAERPDAGSFNSPSEYERVLMLWKKREQESSRPNLPSARACHKLLQESAKRRPGIGETFQTI